MLGAGKIIVEIAGITSLCIGTPFILVLLASRYAEHLSALIADDPTTNDEGE